MLKKENISSQLIVLNVINEVKYMNFGIYRYHLVQILSWFLFHQSPADCWLIIMSLKWAQKRVGMYLSVWGPLTWSLLQASVGHMEANLNRLLLNPLLLLVPFFWFSHLSNGMLQGKKLMAFIWRIMLVAGLLDENKKHRGKWLANNPPLLLLCLFCSVRVEFQWLSYILNFKPIA